VGVFKFGLGTGDWGRDKIAVISRFFFPITVGSKTAPTHIFSGIIILFVLEIVFVGALY